MKKLIWSATVQVINSDHLLIAQAKSSKAELLRRILADDPIWSSGSVRFCRLPMAKNAAFRRGISFRCFTRFDVINRGWQ